jgi:hypothetical protein
LHHKGKSKDFEDKQQLMEQSTVSEPTLSYDPTLYERITTNEFVINLCIQILAISTTQIISKDKTLYIRPSKPA